VALRTRYSRPEILKTISVTTTVQARVYQNLSEGFLHLTFCQLNRIWKNRIFFGTCKKKISFNRMWYRQITADRIIIECLICSIYSFNHIMGCSLLHQSLKPFYNQMTPVEFLYDSILRKSRVAITNSKTKILKKLVFTAFLLDVQH